MSRVRLGALFALFALFVGSACNGEFRFDQASSVNPGGSGGSAGSGGSGGKGSSPIGIAGYDEDEEGLGGVRDANGCAHCREHGLKCAAEWQSCVECVNNDDCSADLPFCDPQMHRCQACDTAEGCDAGSVCDGWSHACMRTCATESDPDLDCDEGSRMCDPRRNVCVACKSDADCSNPASPHCAPGGARCAMCAYDRDCGAGWHCDPLAFVCVECRDSRDCTIGVLCDPAAHTCAASE